MEGGFAIRNTVVSVNVGNYDDIIEDHYPNSGWQFLMFTDKPFKSKLWKPVIVKPESDIKKQSRLYKWLINEYTYCDYSLYIDANVRINADLDKLVDIYLSNADIAMYKHRIRSCIYEEGIICKYFKLDRKETINRQLNRYMESGYPVKNGMYECEVILRRHTEDIENLGKAVWNEICKGSYRDQLSFNWCAWNQKIKVNSFNGRIGLFEKAEKNLIEYAREYENKIIGENINPYFEVREHRV